uniref:Uncharacterized protein n=1 Tax=Peronospora matthiolae TaxID=2874970 RepID=A0AAV1TVY7_9STRA
MWPIVIRGGKNGTGDIPTLVSLEVPGDVSTDTDVEFIGYGSASLAEGTSGETRRGVDDVNDMDAKGNGKTENDDGTRSQAGRMLWIGHFVQGAIVVEPIEIGF